MLIRWMFLAAVLAVPTTASADAVSIDVLSNRADLLSGGDALVAVTHGSGVRIDVDGRDVTESFADRPDGRFEALLTGLQTGANVLSAVLPDGRAARLTLVNHPIGGPVFAGPQTQPWLCTTADNGLGEAKDAQCNAPTVFSFYYKDAASGQFVAYDPDSPPQSSQIATTTTDAGATVPYIIRDERGTIDRGIYDIAVLFDPAKPWAPWAPQPGWNRKLGFIFGGGCAPGHSQQSAQDPKNDMFLSRGYMVAVSSIDVNGNSCNARTSAESLMMIEEHIREAYGPIRFTVGDGCSGGAEQQHSIVDQYPGLLDGIRPECTFPDLWTIGIKEKWTCQLLENYFDTISPQLWATESQRAAVLGGDASQSMCAEITKALNGAEQDFNPSGSGCGTTGDWMYDPVKNRQGTRCTLQDYNVNALGRRSDGFANLPIDEVGLQWGLEALYAGKITAEQFVDLNEKVGGLDIDFKWQPARTAGDVAGIERMYQTDELVYGANGGQFPEIEARADDTYDEHSNVMHAIYRARLDAAAGNHETQVYWQQPLPGAFGMPTPDLHEQTFVVMDKWLTNIEKDTSNAPHRVKVVRNKPPEAKDGCYAGTTPIDQSACDHVQTSNVLPSMVAGEPPTAMVLKCALRPLRVADYEAHNVQFTPDQIERLKKAFPDGVCDWTKPGVGQQAPIGDWLTLDGAQPRPLGAAPQAVALVPVKKGCKVPVHRRLKLRLPRSYGRVRRVEVRQGGGIVARLRANRRVNWNGRATRRAHRPVDGRLQLRVVGRKGRVHRIALVRRDGLVGVRRCR